MKILRVAITALCVALLAANDTVATSGQLLAYQDGFIFFTTGNGFRVAPNVLVLDAQTHAPTSEVPRTRDYARAVFNDVGTVTEVDLSRTPFPPEKYDVSKFAVAISSPMPNPDLVPQVPSAANHGIVHTYSGKLVTVVFTVEVPPSTPVAAQVYITTDKSSWDPEAIPMDRIDLLHFRVMERLISGTQFLYLYDRGSLQSIELGEDHLSRPPRSLLISDADSRSVGDTVYEWADAASGDLSSQPVAIPTPFNPSPFQNLPNGYPTPHP